MVATLVILPPDRGMKDSHGNAAMLVLSFLRARRGYVILKNRDLEVARRNLSDTPGRLQWVP